MKPQDRTRAILRSGLDTEAKIIAIAIADYLSDDAGRAWPAMVTLSRDTGLTTRTLRRRVAAAVAQGWLDTERRAGGSTRYAVAWACPALAPVAVTPDRESPRTGSPPGQGVHPTPDTESTPPGQGVHPTPDRESTEVDQGKGPSIRPSEATTQECAPAATAGPPRGCSLDEYYATPRSPDAVRAHPEPAGLRRVERVGPAHDADPSADPVPPVRAVGDVDAQAAPKAPKPVKAPSGAYQLAVDAFSAEHRATMGTAYPWVFHGNPHDGARVKAWLAAARVDADEPADGIDRIRLAARAYLAAVQARTAWPIGEPAQTRHFTRDVARWLQTDPSVRPVEPPSRNRSRSDDRRDSLAALDLAFTRAKDREDAERINNPPEPEEPPSEYPGW